MMIKKNTAFVVTISYACIIYMLILVLLLQMVMHIIYTCIFFFLLAVFCKPYVCLFYNAE